MINFEQSYTFDRVIFGGFVCHLGSWSNLVSSNRQREVTQYEINNKQSDISIRFMVALELIDLISDPLQFSETILSIILEFVAFHVLFI